MIDEGQVQTGEWRRTNGDIRQVGRCAPLNGMYVLRKEFLLARQAHGANFLTKELEVDLADYDDSRAALNALLTVGYRHQVAGVLRQPGDMVSVGRTQLRLLPLMANYPIALVGLTKRGEWASYVANARAFPCGYVSPPVEAQLHMLAPLFEYAFICSEGLDPTCWTPADGPIETYPVRGQPGGRLAAVFMIHAP